MTKRVTKCAGTLTHVKVASYPGADTVTLAQIVTEITHNSTVNRPKRQQSLHRPALLCYYILVDSCNLYNI